MNILKKIINPLQSHVGNLFLSILLTWIYVIIVLFITMPFITFSEASSPEPWLTALHFALMAPGLAYLLLNISEHFQHVKTFRFLLFPILVFSIPSWGILTLIGFGATVLWFVVFLIQLWLFGLPGALIFGLVLDFSKKRQS